MCPGVVLTLITAETYSKFLHKEDRSVRTIFGDAGAATLIRSKPGSANTPYIGPFSYGTDGSGGEKLIVRQGALRFPSPPTPRDNVEVAKSRGPEHLVMDGAGVFNFAIRAVPVCIDNILSLAGKTLNDIDSFVFHQANRHMLDHLRRKLNIPESKFCVTLDGCGNTVSSTIPIALKHAMDEGKVRDGDLVMLVGFGVGFSWGANLIRHVAGRHRTIF